MTGRMDLAKRRKGALIRCRGVRASPSSASRCTPGGKPGIPATGISGGRAHSRCGRAGYGAMRLAEETGCWRALRLRSAPAPLPWSSSRTRNTPPRARPHGQRTYAKSPQPSPFLGLCRPAGWAAWMGVIAMEHAAALEALRRQRSTSRRTARNTGRRRPRQRRHRAGAVCGCRSTAAPGQGWPFRLSLELERRAQVLGPYPRGPFARCQRTRAYGQSEGRRTNPFDYGLVEA